ncbi:GyrI-like domain-containing protein [Chitinophaga agri]|nr:effector binding domain-containing protein [Chitinophaga agri]
MEIPSFNIIGIDVVTTNENGQSAQDIPALWHCFFSEGIADRIPNKTDQTIYAVYTDYEKDHTKPYTTIVGCKVSTLDEIPAGMAGKVIPAGKYHQQVATGNISQGSVYNEWVKIWNSGLERTFTADFEAYGARAQDPENAAVDIFVAIK